MLKHAVSKTTLTRQNHILGIGSKSWSTPPQSGKERETTCSNGRHCDELSTCNSFVSFARLRSELLKISKMPTQSSLSTERRLVKRRFARRMEIIHQSYLKTQTNSFTHTGFKKGTAICRTRKYSHIKHDMTCVHCSHHAYVGSRGAGRPTNKVEKEKAR